MSFTSFPAPGRFRLSVWQALINELRPLHVYKAADGTPFPSTTALADDEDLTVTASGGGIYIVDSLVCYAAGTTADLKLAWAYPGSGVLDYAADGYTTAGTLDQTLANGVASASSRSFGGLGLGSPRYVRYFGRYAAAADGAFKLQRAQNTSTAENTVIKAGSFLALYRVG